MLVGEGTAAPEGAQGTDAGSAVSDSSPDGGDDKENARERREQKRAADFARENKELKARLAEIENREKESKEALARSEGKLEDIIKAREDDLAKRTMELDDWKGRYDSLEKQVRERDLIDQLAEMEGVSASRKDVRRAYLGIAVDKGLDRYPKDLKKALEERAAILKEEAPHLFSSNTPTGGSPPSGRRKPKPGASPGFLPRPDRS